MNILRSPLCGFAQLGSWEREYSSGECSENDAPRLKVVRRWRERV